MSVIISQFSIHPTWNLLRAYSNKCSINKWSCIVETWNSTSFRALLSNYKEKKLAEQVKRSTIDKYSRTHGSSSIYPHQGSRCLESVSRAIRQPGTDNPGSFLFVFARSRFFNQ